MLFEESNNLDSFLLKKQNFIDVNDLNYTESKFILHLFSLNPSKYFNLVYDLYTASTPDSWFQYKFISHYKSNLTNFSDEFLLEAYKFKKFDIILNFSIAQEILDFSILNSINDIKRKCSLSKYG